MRRKRDGRLAATFTTIALALALPSVTEPLNGHGPSRDSEWSAPLNLGPEVNSAFEDTAPHLSSDGLALYFSSTRPESQGGEDLWVSTRANRHDPWSAAINLGTAINTAANERSPALSRNRRLMFFATDRPGGSGSFDIWLSWRPDPDDELGWQTPVNLGTGDQWSGDRRGPELSRTRRSVAKPGRDAATLHGQQSAGRCRWPRHLRRLCARRVGGTASSRNGTEQPTGRLDACHPARRPGDHLRVRAARRFSADSTCGAPSADRSTTRGRRPPASGRRSTPSSWKSSRRCRSMPRRSCFSPRARVASAEAIST